MRRGPLRCALLIGCLALLSCQPKPEVQKQKEVASRDEAASVTISVSSVIPWSQVSAALQPNFSLASNDALGEVAPITSRTEYRSSSKTSAGVAVTANPTGTNANGGSSAASTPDASADLPDLIKSSSDPGVDPMLKYQAARALYEAVQLMNREVQSAALGRCYVPYLVLLKIAILPYQRDLPYDLHARISFFQQAYSSSTGPAVPGSAGGKTKAAPVGPCASYTGALPQVLPLLATDDIERALASRAALAGLSGSGQIDYGGTGVGGSAHAGHSSQASEAVAAQDINSRLTIARQSFNTIYVRIGAALQGTAHYALIGQTYDVAVVLMVPRISFDQIQDPAVQITTYTQFRDAETGQVLPDRNADKLWTDSEEAIESLLDHSRDTPGLAAWRAEAPEDKQRLMADLFEAVQYSSTSHFVDVICKAHVFRRVDRKCDTRGGKFSVNALAKSLWPQISLFRSDSPFQGAFVRFPVPEPLSIEDQDAVATEDKDDLTIRLGGVKGTTTSGMTARLKIAAQSSGTAQGASSYTFLMTDNRLDPLSHTLALKFPALSKLGVVARTGTLLLSWQACSTEEVCPKVLPPPKDIQVAIIPPPSAPSTASALPGAAGP